MFFCNVCLFRSEDDASSQDEAPSYLNNEFKREAREAGDGREVVPLSSDVQHSDGEGTAGSQL